MIDMIVSDDTASFDIRKPRLYHNLNWDLISGEHSGLTSRKIMSDLRDIMNLGYRLPQDFYEDITIKSYLFVIARERGVTSKNGEDALIKQFNNVITWEYNEPKPDYRPKIGLGSWLLGDPIQTRPGLTIPRLKSDIQPNNVTIEKYGTTRTERIQDIFHRYERDMIKPYYYPLIWVRDSNGNLHLKCTKIV